MINEKLVIARITSANNRQESYKKFLVNLFKRFVAYLNSRNIEEPCLIDCYDFKNSLTKSVGEFFFRIIVAIDFVFSKHWTIPNTIRPFNPLPQPNKDDVEKYWLKHDKDDPIPIDIFCCKLDGEFSNLLIKDSVKKHYRQFINQFRWYCFTNNEHSFRLELIDDFLKFALPLNDYSEKRNIILRIKKAATFLLFEGKLPNNPFKKECKKLDYACDLQCLREKIRKELLLEKDYSEASLWLFDRSLRNIFDCCSIKNLKDLKSLCSKQINKVLSFLKENCSKPTLNHRVHYLKRLLDYLYEQKYVEQKLSSTIFTSKYVRSYVPPYLSLDSQAKIKEEIKNCPLRDQAIVLLALELGLRQSDILNLRLSNLDFKNNPLSIIQQKTKKPLTLHIFPHILELITKYISLERPLPYKDDEKIFLSIKPPFTPLKATWHIIQLLLQNSGVVKENKITWGLHSLRHSFTHTMLYNETPKHIITEALGHSVDTSDRPYLSMQDQMLKKCALDLQLIGLGKDFEK